MQLTHAGPSPVDTKRFACLKPLVRRGIPFELRPTQWHLLSGAAAKQASAGEGAYARMASDALSTLPKNTLLTLAEDVCASCFSFRTHPTFRQAAGIDALKRMMGAYLARNPNGYFRGLAHIAGFILIVMGPASEEAAFWVLLALLEDKMYGYCNAQASYGLKVEGAVLEALVAKKLPKVDAHLTKLGTSSSAMVAPWLSCLFTTVLPSEVTARVFDALLLEGNKVVQRVMLALFKTYEGTILASSHPSQLRTVLDTRAGRLYDGDALMQVAFKGIGAMPGSMVQAMRSAAVAAVDAHLAEQTARLELILCRTH